MNEMISDRITPSHRSAFAARVDPTRRIPRVRGPV